jgi:hypothetical protein
MRVWLLGGVRRRDGSKPPAAALADDFVNMNVEASYGQKVVDSLSAVLCE